MNRSARSLRSEDLDFGAEPFDYLLHSYVRAAFVSTCHGVAIPHEDKSMIMRSWKARALPRNVEAYAQHLRDSVLPALRTIPGHQGAYLLKRDAGASVELVVLTLWESMDALHQFAGNAADEAVVEPAAQAVLESFDLLVQHYDVVVSSPGTVASTI